MELFKTAVILAGGKSSRMGFDKQTITVNGLRLIDLLIQNLSKDFSDILVVSNKPELYKSHSVRVEPDIIPDIGLIGGLHAALNYSLSSYVYLIACDMPHINSAYINYMMKRLKDSRQAICLTRNGQWIEPLNAFYARTLLPELEKHMKTTESKSLFPFIQQQNTCYIDELDARKYCPDYKMFLNLNTQDDILLYEKSNIQTIHGVTTNIKDPKNSF